MGGNRTQQQQQQTQQTSQSSNQATNNTNTYGYAPGAQSPDIDAARNFQFSHDPRIPYTFSRAFERAKDTYANPLGGATTPQLRDATLRASAEDIGQQEGQAYAEEGRSLQGLEFAKLMDVASMTAPRFVQTGSSGTSSGTSTGSGTSSGTSNTTQSQNPLNSIIGGASSMGSALIM